MKKIIILQLFLVMFLFSCKKDVILTGTVKGKVDLLTNEFGDTLSLAGIKVKLKSSLYGDQETTTDPNGYYTFENVNTGTYELIIGESPIAPYKYYFQFVGGEKPYYVPFVKLTYKSTTIPSNITYRADSSGNRYLECDVSPAGTSERPRYIALEIFYYLAKDNSFSIKRLFTYSVEGDHFSMLYNPGTYYKKKIVIYGTSGGEYSTYIDISGNVIFPPLSDVHTDTLFINF